MVPKDELFQKRLSNIKKADMAVGAFLDGLLVGVVYSRKVLGFLPNITWLVREGYRETGIGKSQTQFFLDEVFRGCFVTAYCRNSGSKALARRTGFFVIGNFGLWIR